MQTIKELERDPLLSALSEQVADPKDQQIEELQRDLSAERDARKEERFFFIFLSMILLNIVFFSVMDNWSGPIAITIFQLLFLALLAKRLGMEEVSALVHGLIGRIADGLSKNQE